MRRKENLDFDSAQHILDYSSLVINECEESETDSYEEREKNLKMLCSFLLVVHEYFKESDETKIDAVDTLDNISQIARICANFPDAVKYAKMYLEEKMQIDAENMDEVAIASLYTANMCYSAGIAIAAEAASKLSADEIDKEIATPEEQRMAESYMADATEYYHNAYLLFLQIAIRSAAKLNLCDAALEKRLDDDHITATVNTLVDAVSKDTANEQISVILDYINTAIEMSERCGECDGISFEEIVAVATNAVNGDNCCCEEGCSCEEEEEEEEEEGNEKRDGEEEEVPSKKMKTSI